MASNIINHMLNYPMGVAEKFELEVIEFDLRRMIEDHLEVVVLKRLALKTDPLTIFPKQ